MANYRFAPEQLEAAKAAKSPEELITMAKEQGFTLTHEQAAKILALPVGELSDEELENVAGGGCLESGKCSKCGEPLTDYRGNIYCAKCTRKIGFF